ncbi:ABC transporter ATP-binding protein [Chamaesiphon minutus]|uniref:ABC-type multidrug transport system, ATPase and permease component n=1 Tax=Chamaesiphon minutus (strain ATCC 27169 / PCC 6605) TaxID=1173020 RepID=K9UR02_CHAP6|nr:ABC transporter ATP-binding protein [Chamaesiphon minutus]AFY96679.1 ABC-type multidrug transport system, ATPase and permease component [Chamaesiphon minutus PCC 6605]
MSRFQKLLNYLNPYKWQTAQGIFALFVVNALSVYIPLLIRDGIDRLKTSFTSDYLTQLAIFLVGLTSIMWVVRMISRILIFGVGRQVQATMKQNIFEHILRLEPGYFVTTTVGDLINRFTSDVENIMRLVGFAVLSTANIVFAYALTLPAMLYIDVKLTLLALAVYPLMLITVQLFSQQLRDQQVVVQESISDLSELIQEDMSGISLIKIYAQEENERRAFRKKNQELFNANLKLAESRNTIFPIIQGLASISLLVLLWQGGLAIANQEISIGGFLSLIIFAQNLIFPTALLGFTITAYQRGEVSIDRVEAILFNRPKIADTPASIHLDVPIRGQISARDFSYTHPGAETPALKHLNFTINAGETIAIVGPIGSGKSTLANAIPRLVEIPEKSLFIDDYDVNSLSLDDLRKSIAYVPQESFLFSTSIENNIRYGEPLASRSKVEAAAQQGQIHWEVLNFPQQYDTIVGERGITLSGGQRQRTALARALLMNAPILILDDALSSVDNQTATAILQNLSHTGHKRTVIFITHQLSAAATADRIMVMDKGEIVQTGSHQELIGREGLYQWLCNQNQLEELLH